VKQQNYRKTLPLVVMVMKGVFIVELQIRHAIHSSGDEDQLAFGRLLGDVERLALFFVLVFAFHAFAECFYTAAKFTRNLTDTTNAKEQNNNPGDD
jgi:hypothetical protein